MSERPEEVSCLLTAPQLLPASERECGCLHPCCVQLPGQNRLLQAWLGAGVCVWGGDTVGTQGRWAEAWNWAARTSSTPRASLDQHSPWELVLENSPKRDYTR